MEDPVTDLMRRAFGCYRERDLDALIGLVHPAIVAVDATPLAAKHVYQGRDEILAMLRERDSQFADYQAEARTFTVTPDGRVLAEGFARYKRAGAGQGAAQAFYWLCEVRDDMIVRWESFTDRHEALAAAGLRPGPGSSAADEPPPA
jgi:ketosteroid isomerase-like protein